jgi:hypothetical protein
MTTIDLRSGATLPPRYQRIYNGITTHIDAEFIRFVDSVSGHHADSIDWWVSSPASRENLKSPLYHYCCCLVLIRLLVDHNEPVPSLVTDSKALKNIIERYAVCCGKNLPVLFKPKPLKYRIKQLRRLYQIPLRRLRSHAAARKLKPVGRRPQGSLMRLIDTYIVPGFSAGDRYFPDLLTGLSDAEKDGVWFAPFLTGFKPADEESALLELRRSERNYLIKEDYLKLTDYLFAWGHLLRIRFLRFEPARFFGFDLSGLIKEETRALTGFGSSFYALLNFRFAMRLKEAGIRPLVIIDWFENQAIDRGWNAGFRRFHPDSLTKGYQGFVVSPDYLCVFPTPQEKKSAVIPQRISTCGKAFIPMVRRYCPDIDVEVAPAFRFADVWKKERSPGRSETGRILVALPIIQKLAVSILDMVSLACDSLKAEIAIRIKPHPTTRLEKILYAMNQKLPERAEIVHGTFEACINESDLLISAGSSVCLETMARGIPILLVGSSSGMFFNNIPESARSDLFRICYDAGSLLAGIQYYFAKTESMKAEFKKMGDQIRDAFFTPVTPSLVRKFLEI